MDRGVAKGQKAEATEPGREGPQSKQIHVWSYLLLVDQTKGSHQKKLETRVSE